jgi:hypothetical protein
MWGQTMKITAVILLVLFSTIAFSQEINVTKRQWLSFTEENLPPHLCKPESPLMDVYTGENCVVDMRGLFRKCTTEVEDVVIPTSITSSAQMDDLTRKIANCIYNHYQGHQAISLGASLKGKIKNWSNTGMCSNLSPDKEILVLPVFVKRRGFMHPLVAGVEIMNCTDAVQTLSLEDNKAMLYLERLSDNNDWVRQWDLSPFLEKDRRAWVLPVKHSWNLQEFKNADLEQRSDYRFALVMNGSVFFSREFKGNIESQAHVDSTSPSAVSE